MSEFKGQLLGIVLVIAAFAAIGTVLVTAFQSSAEAISSKISSADNASLLSIEA